MTRRGTTPQRSFRCGDDIWNGATHVADLRNENLSDVIRDALEQYVRDHLNGKSRCTAMHPDDGPRCLLGRKHNGWHEDENGNAWPDGAKPIKKGTAR